MGAVESNDIEIRTDERTSGWIVKVAQVESIWRKFARVAGDLPAFT